MKDEEQVIVKTSWFSRDLLEQMFRDIQKNKPAVDKKKARKRSR